MSRVCSTCGGSDIDFDPSRGDTVCTNCGSVLEESAIVSEVGFQETSAGGSSVIGQFVSSEGNKVGQGLGFRPGYGRESRTITLDNGKRRLNALASQLKLNNHCAESAYMFFKLAVSKRLTKGRRSNHVAAACLYLVCRTEKTPHLLIDFSDILQVDVITLGKVYLKLQHELCINLPVVDPCLYIHRFCHQFQLGEKENNVANTALRLVSRMKRDWIQYGRRPSGLCGAAILVAARLHGFSRTIKQVIKVVRLSNTTIRKRLNDFKKTPSGQLTVDEFNNIDLEEEQDPPCFTEARQKQKQQQMDEIEGIDKPALASELEELRHEIEERLVRTRSKSKFKNSFNSEGIDTDALSECSTSLSNDIDKELDQTGDIASILDVSTEKDTCDSTGVTEDSFACDSGINVDSLLTSNNGATDDSLAGDNGESGDKAGDSGVILDSLTDDNGVSGDQVGDSGVILDSLTDDNGVSGDQVGDSGVILDSLTDDNGVSGDQVGDSGVILDSLTDDNGVNGDKVGERQNEEVIEEINENDNIVIENENNEKDANNEEDEDEKLDDLDDDELDDFILTKSEVEIKTKIWMEENKDYLEKQREKEEREAEEREKDEADPSRKKRRKPYKRKPKEKANSACEAVEKMLIEKKISHKINYDVLRNLNKENELQKPSDCQPEAPTVVEPVSNLIQAVQPSIPVRYTGRKRDKNFLPKLPTKRVKFLDSISESPMTDPDTQALHADGMVVESGPVEYADHEHDDVDDDEEDDTHFSAAQLMGNEYGAGDAIELEFENY